METLGTGISALVSHDGTLKSSNGNAKNDIGNKGQSDDLLHDLRKICELLAPAGPADSLANSPRPRVEAPAAWKLILKSCTVRLVAAVCSRKALIICQPDSVAELLICAKYQQLILSDLNLSTDAEMGGQRNGDTLIQKILSIHPSKERLKMNLFLLNKLTLFHL